MLSAAPRRLLALLAALASALLLLGAPAARAEDPAAPAPPVRLVIATAGLTWEDVDAQTTPALQDLADGASLAAMNTTSTTVVSTKRQGLETLRTGFRGRAEDAPRTAGIPTPPEDQWAQLPVETVEIDATSQVPTDQIEQALAGETIVLVDVGSVPDHGDFARTDALAALDDRVGQVLAARAAAETGVEGVAEDDPLRTLLVSVAATDPADPDAVERTGAVASRTVGLQVAIDTLGTGAPGPATLRSGATKQDGIVMLTDVAPTILSSYDSSATRNLPGQRVVPVPHDAAQQLAVDRSQAARLVDRATLPALGSWMALGVIGVVILLVPPLARRPRLAAVGRALATIAPLALPVGLVAQIVPWWRAEHPALALTAAVWAGSALLAAVVLFGPWRRHRSGPVGVAAALIAGIILLESAAGSHLQISSPLGAQPISGGRFYGLSNHLFGLVLAATMMALLCLFLHVHRPVLRVIATVLVGGTVAAVCLAPSMGADFGSGLATIPAFGLLALLVSGVRLRVWHVLALGAGGVGVVLGVSVLDWLRPPQQRTHLGQFIDELLDGDLLAVIVRKLAQNVQMLTGYWALALVVALAVALSVAILLPRRLRLQRLVGLDEQHPVAYRVRIAQVAGAWVGYAVNDTGPVLVAAMLGIWLAHLPAVLPDPGTTSPERAQEPSPAGA